MRSLVSVTCMACGKVQQVGKHRAKEYKTCSLACRSLVTRAHNRLDLVGKRFSRLVVVAEGKTKMHPSGSSHSSFVCECDCGSVVSVIGTSLTTGNTTSCGCFNLELLKARATHAMTGTRTYRIWQAMRNRCRNTNMAGWQNYGGRGIRVCERWSSFENFLSDMGESPPGHEIDRIDNNGIYEPNNCRWATREQQSRNKRSNRIISFNGQSKCMKDWARKFRLTNLLWLRDWKNGPLKNH